MLRSEGEAASEKSFVTCTASDSWGTANMSAVREAPVMIAVRIRDHTGVFFANKDVSPHPLRIWETCEGS